MQTNDIGVLEHPKQVYRNLEADQYTFEYLFDGKYMRFPFNLIIFPIRVLRYIFRKINNT